MSALSERVFVEVPSPQSQGRLAACLHALDGHRNRALDLSGPMKASLEETARAHGAGAEVIAGAGR